ncbi:MAG: LysR substrate-binding domain-containing protein [Acidiferrobacterales bacterium]|nr:LysR substrate-binding domain-containing protein [Acidiferrobacterales bacterium]
MDALTDIAVFIQVVKADSFTAAAADLNLSRSVVSKYITRLEDRLGVRLLNRTTRRLSLTEAGQHFYEQSRAALAQLEEAEDEIRAMQATPRGLLRISVPSSFGVMHIAPMMPRFQALYPDLNIELMMEDRLIDIVDTATDLAIRIAEMPDSSMIARRIATCRYVICGAPAYFERHGLPQTPEDLRHHNCLLFRFWDTPNQWQFNDAQGKFVGVHVSGNLVSNNSLALRELLLSGSGISTAPSFLVGEDIAQGRLRTVLSDYQIKPLSIYAVYPHREYLTAKVRAYLEFLSQQIDADKPYWEEE